MFQVWDIHKDGLAIPSQVLSNALLHLTSASTVLRDDFLDEAGKLLSAQDEAGGAPGSDAHRQATTLLHVISESLKKKRK